MARGEDDTIQRALGGDQRTQRPAAHLTLAALETRGKTSGELFEKTVQSMGSQPAMAILMVTGHYIAHGLIVNTPELKLPCTPDFTKRG